MEELSHWARSISIFVLLILTLAGCTPSGTVGVQPAEKDALTVFKRFYEATSAKDIDTAMTFVAENAVFANEQGRWSGPGPIRAYLHGGLIENNITFELSDFKQTDNKVTYTYKISMNGNEIDTGQDGLAIVENSKIIFFGTEAYMPKTIITTTQQPAAPQMGAIIPLPASAKPTGSTFNLNPTTKIYVEPGAPGTDEELRAIGRYLADKLKASTGYDLQVASAEGAPQKGGILLTTIDGDPALEEEGYELTVTPDGVNLKAYRPAGLFRGIQTIRQLLPAAIESPGAQPGPWTIPSGTIRDTPRFAWRGAMLDVSRHFFKLEDVKRYIDLLAYYKINYFHIHLTDDQGWRIEIKSWPKLTEIGGSTQVGGGPGGYYTQDEYAQIVAYAQNRYITVVPEIDMPGHTNAALASYPELNCNDTAPSPYTGTSVGFSSLCIEKDITYAFIDDVIREIAALTPGPYIHIGGDEAKATKTDEYIRFIERVQKIVQANGKQIVGWDEITEAEVLPGSLVHHWNLDPSKNTTPPGTKIIMSIASKAYMDMKYDPSTPLGADWAGFISVKDGYDWDPATVRKGISETDILGVEAPLWSETLATIDEIEYMTFPRLLGYAEIGWSPAAGRSWDEYRVRLGAQGPRLTLMGVDFYPSPEVPWK